MQLHLFPSQNLLMEGELVQVVDELLYKRTTLMDFSIPQKFYDCVS